MALTLEEVADAFGALSQRRPEALIELLDAEVTWAEHLGARQSRVLIGARAVADFLFSRVESACNLELTGIEKTARATLDVGYTEPWWLDRQGMGARLAYFLLGDARQSALLADRISRIDSHATYFAPRAFEIRDSHEGDLISLLRR